MGNTAGGNPRLVVLGPAVVCWKAVSSVSVPWLRASAIAANRASEPRGDGRVGRPSKITGRQRPAKRNARGKAVATASASESGNSQRHQMQFRKPRG